MYDYECMRNRKDAFNYRPRKKYDGRLYFQFVCQFTPGGGVPHLHPIILPLVPCPFGGDSSPVQGEPHPGLPPVRSGWGTPQARSGWGTPPKVMPRAVCLLRLPTGLSSWIVLSNYKTLTSL